MLPRTGRQFSPCYYVLRIARWVFGRGDGDYDSDPNASNFNRNQARLAGAVMPLVETVAEVAPTRWKALGCGGGSHNICVAVLYTCFRRSTI